MRRRQDLRFRRRHQVQRQVASSHHSCRYREKGSHGNGPWHMPPHPEVSDADAKAMVRYILSLKK
jgi:cytochrome c551/c552